MQFSRQSPWYVILTVAVAAILTIAVQVIFDGGIDWVAVALISGGVAVGTVIGTRIGSSRRQKQQP